MDGRVKSIIVSVLMLFTFAVIIVDNVPVVEGPAILEVDDSGGKPYTSIQAAVDDAQPGDTVFVYAGFYNEDVIIEKTINLTGENRDTTIINGSVSNGSIWARYSDYINVSGFTLQNGGTGISIYYSNFSKVENCKAIFNKYGIIISNSNGSVVANNIASNNSDYHGIYLDRSTNITVKNNIGLNNAVNGVYVFDSSKNNIITNNNFSYNYGGIHLTTDSDNNFITDNILLSNNQYGIYLYDAEKSTLFNNTLINNNKGIYIRWDSNDNKIINSTVKNSQIYDIGVSWNSHIDVLNTSFNKTNSYFNTIDSIINVQWYLHVNVIDYLGNPVPNANIKIEDCKNGTYNETFLTDSSGYVRWITLTEYIEQDLSGDTIGEKMYYTPHRIVAWNDTLVGYAYPEPFMNKSKTVTIVLYNGTLMKLEPGWNLISLPRPQLETNLQTVLKSIEGRYDSIQWYNITDIFDPWKHYHILKPSSLNDLQMLNYTMGFWLHITEHQGTILVVFGDEFISDQNIPLYPGWNLVGYPSKSNKTRDIALDNLFFDTDVDSIWTYNASTGKWVKLDEATDYFEVGKGYWVHSKVTEVWNVPL